MAKKATAVKVAVQEMPRKGRKPVPENETREQKLMRLAEARVTKACKYISLVGNLAAYRPNAVQIGLIMSALGESCANVNNRLDGSKKETVTFRLVQ